MGIADHSSFWKQTLANSGPPVMKVRSKEVQGCFPEIPSQGPEEELERLVPPAAEPWGSVQDSM